MPQKICALRRIDVAAPLIWVGQESTKTEGVEVVTVKTPAETVIVPAVKATIAAKLHTHVTVAAIAYARRLAAEAATTAEVATTTEAATPAEAATAAEAVTTAEAAEAATLVDEEWGSVAAMFTAKAAAHLTSAAHLTAAAGSACHRC